jgi:hypothetical protein
VVIVTSPKAIHTVAVPLFITRTWSCPVELATSTRWVDDETLMLTVAFRAARKRLITCGLRFLGDLIGLASQDGLDMPPAIIDGLGLLLAGRDNPRGELQPFPLNLVSEPIQTLGNSIT